MTPNMFTKPVKPVSQKLAYCTPVQIVKRNSPDYGRTATVGTRPAFRRQYRVTFITPPSPVSVANTRIVGSVPQQRECEYFYRSELKRLDPKP